MIALNFRESNDVRLRSVSIERNSASPTKHNKTWYAELARTRQQVYFRIDFLTRKENLLADFGISNSEKFALRKMHIETRLIGSREREMYYEEK